MRGWLLVYSLVCFTLTAFVLLLFVFLFVCFLLDLLNNSTILLFFNNLKTATTQVDLWWISPLLSYCLLSSVISSTTYHLATVGSKKTCDSFKPIFDWHHGYGDILDIDGICGGGFTLCLPGASFREDERTD